MAQPPPRERTLRELAAPDFTYESLCIQFLDEDVPFVLKTGLIHLLPKFHGLAVPEPALESDDLTTSKRKHPEQEEPAGGSRKFHVGGPSSGFGAQSGGEHTSVGCIQAELAAPDFTYESCVHTKETKRVDELFFPADFYVLDKEEGFSHGSVPIILDRPFLKTTHTKIDVYADTLSMEFGDIVVHFNILDAMKYPSEDHAVFRAEIINDIIDEHISDFYSYHAMKHSFLFDLCTSISCIDIESNVYFEIESECEFDSLGSTYESDFHVEVQDVEPLTPPPTQVLSTVQQTPTPELELKSLLENLKYAYLGDGARLPMIISTFLDVDQEERLLHVLRKHKKAIGWTMADIPGGPQEDKPIVVKNERDELIPTRIHTAPEDQEKTTFTCPFNTFAYRRMPFGLCNAPGTFQRCMLSIFSDFLENCIEVFLDDFTVYGSSFDTCLDSLDRVLNKCIETNLVLNFEKFHFMVEQGVVLGHIISSRGIEVNPGNISIIAQLPYPSCVREVRYFLGHVGFYRRFIKDFSKKALPLSNLLKKDVDFNFDDRCKEAFDCLKKALTTTPIIQALDWTVPFELMCDASNYALGVVLAQRVDKLPRVIYYASRTLDVSQANYMNTKKELLTIIFALDKFWSYFLGSCVVIFTDHVALKYLLKKAESKPRLIRWMLWL
ncbi:hypothetical protein VNO78_21626 [Psophocarpus tetragonolobus]|uniref:RNA-directed DNA polymerase n=1 Tax=Psophocarpus tetragonolobus TaxID=3891 RepID=A0AAN9SBB8_PSOTE